MTLSNLTNQELIQEFQIMNQIPYKYLALGILVGYLIPYIYTLTQTKSE